MSDTEDLSHLQPDDAGAPEVELWNCGNNHLVAQLCTLIAIENRISHRAALDAIESWTTEAGPDFCRRMIASIGDRHQPVPF